MFSKLLNVANRVFTKYPLIVNSVVYGTFYSCAELSQQTITRKILPEIQQDYDIPQVYRYGVIGTFFYAPSLHFWYKWLDKAYVGAAPRMVFKKLMMDQFIFTPFLLVGFFVGMSILERKNDLLEECKAKIIPSFKTSCLFWLPAQTLNFMLVPPRFRVVYVASCAFGWINIICYIKRQKYKTTEEPLS